MFPLDLAHYDISGPIGLEAPEDKGGQREALGPQTKKSI
jgi:hypothetical protein